MERSVMSRSKTERIIKVKWSLLQSGREEDKKGLCVGVGGVGKRV
jgi:hypothetical protein